MVYRIKGIFVSSEKDLLTATVNIHYLSSFILFVQFLMWNFNHLYLIVAMKD